jgi:hypothetical protein
LHLAGAVPAGATGDRWQAAHGRYVERFGSEATTIGPPPGRE